MCSNRPISPTDTRGSSTASPLAPEYGGEGSKKRRSLGGGGGLHHAEDVALRVLTVGQPADAENGHLRQGDGAAARRHLIDAGIELRDLDGAHVGGDRLAVDGPAPPDQSAVDAGLIVGASHD